MVPNTAEHLGFQMYNPDETNFDPFISVCSGRILELPLCSVNGPHLVPEQQDGVFPLMGAVSCFCLFGERKQLPASGLSEPNTIFHTLFLPQ